MRTVFTIFAAAAVMALLAAGRCSAAQLSSAAAKPSSRVVVGEDDCLFLVRLEGVLEDSKDRTQELVEFLTEREGDLDERIAANDKIISANRVQINRLKATEMRFREQLKRNGERISEVRARVLELFQSVDRAEKVLILEDCSSVTDSCAAQAVAVRDSNEEADSLVRSLIRRIRRQGRLADRSITAQSRLSELETRTSFLDTVNFFLSSERERIGEDNLNAGNRVKNIAANAAQLEVKIPAACESF